MENEQVENGKKINYRKEVINVLWIIVASVLGAFGMHVFVYSSDFAPIGVDGIATMLQTLTHVNAGIYTLALNLPLVIAALVFLKKRYVIYTIVFTVITSGLLILLESVHMWQYVTETDRLISALFSGIMLGLRTGIMLKIGGSTGGADIIACLVQRKRPYGSVEKIISIVCYVIMGLSFFVYKNINCIFLSIVQLIVFEFVTRGVLSPTRNAIEVKIITRNPEEIKNEILYNLKHGATVVESKGMYTEEGNSIVFSVINQRQVPQFMKLIKKYPDTFAYYNEVYGIHGNFRWNRDDVAK